MLFVGTSIIHPSTEGVFLLCNILDLLIYRYKFDFPTMLISLACFITIYEIMMYIYSEKIKKISIKEIMIE